MIVVVVDWEAALVVDLDGYAEDVLFVLELAKLQLEEFRWMGRSLDRYLEREYLDLARPPWWIFGAGAGVLRSLRRLRIDLAKLADQVTHITKFVGDWHLARVYLLARERFHLDQWRASVEQRLSQLDDLYRSEFSDDRRSRRTSVTWASLNCSPGNSLSNPATSHCLLPSQRFASCSLPSCFSVKTVYASGSVLSPG